MFRLFPSARVDAVDHLYAAMSNDRTPLETAIPKSNLEAERKHQKLAEVELQQRLHAPVLDDDILPQRRTMLSPDDIVAIATAMTQLRAIEAQKTQPAAPAVAPVPQFRQFANPAPLGLGGFAMTTMVLSVFNAGLISASVEDVVLPLALWYGGVAQALAGMWEFAVGNTFGATAFTSYGFFWMSFATLKKFVLTDFAASNISSDTIHDGVGLFLLVWTIFSIYMMFASFRTTRALSLVFILLVPAFILLTVGAFRMNENATKAGGWFGIFCAATAWYISAAESINGTFKREIFPIGRMTAATPLIPVINAETLGSIFDGCKQTPKREEMV